MNNPEDAALAVAAAAHLPAMWHKNRWWIWLVDAGFIAFVAAAPLLALYTWKLTLVTPAIAVPGAFVTFVLLPHWSRRSAEAERLNRALLETFGREGSEALRRVEAA